MSTPASSSHLQTWSDSPSVLPFGSHGSSSLHVLARRDLEAEEEVVADLGADRAHDLEREARAVLQRAAVLVLTVVDRRREELGEEHAVRACELHAVEAGFARATGSLRRTPDDAAGSPRRVMRVAGKPLTGSARSLELHAGQRLQAGHHPLAAGEDELDDVAAIELVDAPAQLAPERERLVGVDVRVAGDDVPAGVHRRVRRDDRADPAAREADVPVDAHLRARAVVVVEAARRRSSGRCGSSPRGCGTEAARGSRAWRRRTGAPSLAAATDSSRVVIRIPPAVAGRA